MDRFINWLFKVLFLDVSDETQKDGLRGNVMNPLFWVLVFVAWLIFIPFDLYYSEHKSFNDLAGEDIKLYKEAMKRKTKRK